MLPVVQTRRQCAASRWRMPIIYRITRDSTEELGRWVSAMKVERDLKRRFPDRLLGTVTFRMEEAASPEEVLVMARNLLDAGGTL